MLQNLGCQGVYFDLPHGFPSGAFEAKIEAANSCK